VTATTATAFWPAGTEILWHYRSSRSPVESVRPMRVVRDDATGLVAWLAPGTPVLRPALADGAELRSVPMAERFDAVRHGRATRLDAWHGQGVLKVAPAGTPWSVWLFWSEDWDFRGWYVNLEDPHQRLQHSIVTQDHVLDVVVLPDRETERKDEDELASAVASGRFTAADAERFRANADAVDDVVRRWDSPFGDHWEDWRPDPGWPTPLLPPDLVASATYR
jgi:predicted RNA-binding protein associated with RNAse of E/G family